jgi:hypothetical protein
MRRNLTVAEAIAFLTSLPEEAKDKPLLVSVEAGYVKEQVCDKAEIDEDRVIWSTTGLWEY